MPNGLLRRPAACGAGPTTKQAPRRRSIDVARTLRPLPRPSSSSSLLSRLKACKQLKNKEEGIFQKQSQCTECEWCQPRWAAAETLVPNSAAGKLKAWVHHTSTHPQHLIVRQGGGGRRWLLALLCCSSARLARRAGLLCSKQQEGGERAFERMHAGGARCSLQCMHCTTSSPARTCGGWLLPLLLRRVLIQAQPRAALGGLRRRLLRASHHTALWVPTQLPCSAE